MPVTDPAAVISEVVQTRLAVLKNSVCLSCLYLVSRCSYPEVQVKLFTDVFVDPLLMSLIPPMFRYFRVDPTGV